MAKYRKLKPRTYKLERNARRYMAVLQHRFQHRSFYVAPVEGFRWAVFTKQEPVTLAPRAAVICA